jgi:penicillin G amidase
MPGIQDLIASTVNVCLTGLGRARRPRIQGSCSLGGLDAAVEVYRDRWGVPHIYAATMHDLMFAQGFVHAQDRLWQMDFQRRLIAGRLAEIFGPAVLPVDRAVRTLGLRRVAEQEADLLSAEGLADIAAFAAGVNACMAQRPLPTEFTLLRYRPEPWTPADSLSWAKMMAWTLSINWETELLRARLIERLGPQRARELEPAWREEWPVVAAGMPPTIITEHAPWAAQHPPSDDAPPIAETKRPTDHQSTLTDFPTGRDAAGSNNWVVAGKRTATGMPLLANDMHLLLSAPAIWYENHLVLDPALAGKEDGGKTEPLNITGVTFPGIPYIVAGHNGYVAWGYTNGFADVQDLYIERLRRSDDGVQYEHNGEWRAAEVRQEIIPVKGGAAAIEEVIVTRHGPIINSLAPGLASQFGPREGDAPAALPDAPLALRWTALEPNRMIDALRGMIHARTCLEFEAGLADWIVPVQNVVYADTQGNIGYTHMGRIPIRAQGDGSVPVPGWTDEYEWIGYIPFEELPHLYNPPQGFVVSANNRVPDAAYPHFISNEFAQGDRAQRIVEMLASRPKIDIEFIRRMHFDSISPTMQIVAGVIGQMQVTEPNLKRVVELVRRWDGRLAHDSTAAAVCEIFARQMIRLILENKLEDGASAHHDVRGVSLTARVMGKGPTPLLQEGSFFVAQTWQWLVSLLRSADSEWFDLGHGETRDDVLRLALTATVDYLAQQFGAPAGPQMEGWGWGRIHGLVFGHVAGVIPALDKHFNRGPYPLPGDGNTIWATGSGVTPEAKRAVVGPPFRFIADLSDLRNCLGLLAPGNSGRPDSPHYDDQIAAWYAGGYHPMLYGREDVLREAQETLRLECDSAIVS